MKSSSYILLCAAVVLLAGAFIAPMVLLKRPSTARLEIDPADVVSRKCAPFSAVSVKAGDYSFVMPLRADNDSESVQAHVWPEIVIIADADVRAPQIAMPRSWADNVTLEAGADTLAVIFDMKALLRTEDSVTEIELGDESPAITITVPQGMLRHIEADGAHVRLTGAVQPQLSAGSCTSLTMSHSRIEEMKIHCDAESKLMLCDDSFIGRLKADTPGTLIINSDKVAAIDTLIVAPASHGCSIAVIGSGVSNTVVRPEVPDASCDISFGQ